MKLQSLKLASILVMSITLLGCSATQTMIKKKELSVESKTSYSVVLEPVAPAKRIVYAKVRDLSGNGMRKDMQLELENIFRSEGFTVTNDPEQANMMIIASIIAAEKGTGEDAANYLNNGYQSGVEGAATIGAIAAATGSNGRQALGAAVIGGVGGFLADTFVEDVYYTFVMDVELRERPLEGDVFANTTSNASAKGVASNNTLMSSNSSSTVTRGANYNWVKYETRIVTTANKMNLEIQEAIPEVQHKTAETLTEMML